MQLQHATENKVIRVFFRSLMSRTPEIVEVAKEGLQSVINREKLGKELLQHCLRPVLLNLADYRKLSVPLLDGLSRLLQLLSNCFNVTLGEKLLEHLRYFADPSVLQKNRDSAGNSKKPDDEVGVAASIIELFHLLPPAPNKFLEPLVMLTLKLEGILPILNYYGGYGMGAHSPYRKPLMKFLNADPKRTVEFFIRRLSIRKLACMFQSVIRSEEGAPIRRVGGASALVTFICVLCTLRTQILPSTCNSVSTDTHGVSGPVDRGDVPL
jgi:transformation/transcription domain-associated protein